MLRMNTEMKHMECLGLPDEPYIGPVSRKITAGYIPGTKQYDICHSRLHNALLYVTELCWTLEEHFAIPAQSTGYFLH